MLHVVVSLFMVALVILGAQSFRYALSLTGGEMQSACRNNGIFFAALGASTFLIPSPPAVFGGIVLLMLGLRMIARGLDRLDKTVYIDRYRGEDETTGGE